MTKNKLLLSGNEAMAEAAIRAGCFFYAGYPITPQNELTAYMAKRMPQEKRVFIQAESEIAAINMVLGAGATGNRAMTSSSSPGISLKQEGISYMAGCQLPAVIINVMRGGPGLGNISSSQSDYFQATRGGGHGDYFTPVLAPFSVQEAAELVMLAFDIADYYRTPTIVLADAIIGQMCEPLLLPKKSNFTKKIPPKKWALKGADKEAKFIKSLFLKEGDLEKHNQILQKKWEKIRKNEQRCAVYKVDDAKYIAIAYGSQARITLEAIEILRNQNIKIGLFRPISLWPYPVDKLQNITKNIEKIFVIEQSLGQMLEDVKLALPNKKIHFLGRTGGGVPTVKEIIAFVKKFI
ncbi:MAG: 3-methyl-2-oxobutanoate dehydrogenase subunit VorB [Candidatus Omnitrophica bacterium]|nr:3-methyl-2-oxobutanoate dehydrogenase subunit VorB [Candidatus Omnitrophota bacterium]MCM8831890.1 3-methyl-2-oxobutanoate dehydrogenase subunit VorB [Candidatus Omnitrophota bacterium]